MSKQAYEVQAKELKAGDTVHTAKINPLSGTIESRTRTVAETRKVGRRFSIFFVDGHIDSNVLGSTYYLKIEV